MKIAVLGAGAIGSLVAGYLKKEKEDVVLIGKEETVKVVNANGLEIKGVRGDFKIKIDIYEKIPYYVDLIILAVKTQDIQKAVEENLDYFKKALVLTTQNGVVADEVVANYIEKGRIISSIIMFGATYLENGQVVHNFEGDWIIGDRFKTGIDLEKIKKILEKSFCIKVTDEIEGMKWLKIFLNANNCIPAILGVSMQECFSDLEISEISIGIWQEFWEIINKAEIKLISLPNFPLERITNLINLERKQAAKIFSEMMKNLSKEPLYGSILQSIKRNRPSEIDYINGEIVNLAKKNFYHVPLNKKLVELVHQVEKTKRFFSKEEFLEKTKKLLPREKEKDKEYVNTPFPRLKLTVEKIEGDCYHGYKLNDEIILEDFTHPPKYFCLGLAHALFPVIYALSFGARFPFSPNQRSLSVTCPDGGKLQFKVEIIDQKGNVEYISQDKNYKGPQPKDLIIEVVKTKGNCAYGYKLGDKFKIKGLRCPEGFCGAAYHTAFPALFALNFGANFFFMDKPNSIDTVTCPDGGKIIFKITREEKCEEK